MLCICQNSQNFADKERTLVCANSENRLGGYGIPGRNTERDKRSEACCRRMRQPPGVGGGQGSLTRLTLGTERACHPSPLPPGACGSRGATPIRGLQTPAFPAPGSPRASELCQEKVAVEDTGPRQRHGRATVIAHMDSDTRPSFKGNRDRAAP